MTELKRAFLPLSISLLLILTACGQAGSGQPTATQAPEPAAHTPAPTAVASQPTATTEPTATGQAQATLEPAPELETPTETAVPEPEEAAPEPEIDWLAVEGKTAEGLTYLGNPDAPLTIIDYSDFL